MALQQCGTNTLSDSAGWHWKQKHSNGELIKLQEVDALGPRKEFE